jgi:hypothetical protein
MIDREKAMIHFKASVICDDDEKNCVKAVNILDLNEKCKHCISSSKLPFSTFSQISANFIPKKVYFSTIIAETGAHKYVMHEMLSDHKLIHYENEHRTRVMIESTWDGLLETCIIEA